MPDLDLTRLPRGQRGWTDFLEAVSGLDDSAERYFLEFKSGIDLTSKAGQIKVVKFILGALNRDPVKAAKRFDGHALMVLMPGSGPADVTNFEAKDLAETVRKYVGAEGNPLWDFERVERSDGRAVAVVIVAPPTGNVWTSLRDGTEVRDGGIYVRGDGETREAKGDEVRELIRRAATNTPEVPTGQRALDQARRAATAIGDDSVYPSASTGSVSRAGLTRTRDFVRELEPLLGTCVELGAEGRGRDTATATQIVVSLARDGFAHRGGQQTLINLHKLPALLVTVAGAVGATAANNSEMFAAFVGRPHVDATGMGHLAPVIAVISPWDPFGPSWQQAQLVAGALEGHPVTDEAFAAYDRGRIDRTRRSAGSDIVRRALQQPSSPLVMGEADYRDLFDKAEVLIGAITLDWGLQQPGPSFGAENWVSTHIAGSRYTERSPVDRVLSELGAAGEDWWPLRGGSFGGDIGRARDAVTGFAALAAEARRNRY